MQKNPDFCRITMATILVTGGCGYIGSHTVVDLLDNGYDVISVDNNSRSNPRILDGIERITGKKIKNYKVDLCNFDDTFAIFQENDIRGIIHFAAYKSVGESVEKPLMYFENNLNSLINLLKCVQEFEIPYFVFSSSYTVYGNPDEIPVTEKTQPKPAESPYGYADICSFVISTLPEHIPPSRSGNCLLVNHKTWCPPLHKQQLGK